MAHLYPWRWITGWRDVYRRAAIQRCLETAEGQELMAWLIENCHVLTTTRPIDGKRQALADQRIQDHNEGRRSVALELLDMVRVKPRDFAAMSQHSETRSKA